MLTADQWAFCNREGFHVTWTEQWPVFTAWLSPDRVSGTRFLLVHGMAQSRDTSAMRSLEYVRVHWRNRAWEVLTLLRNTSGAGLFAKQWPGYGLKEALGQARTIVGVRVRAGSYLVPVGGPYEVP